VAEFTYAQYVKRHEGQDDIDAEGKTELGQDKGIDGGLFSAPFPTIFFCVFCLVRVHAPFYRTSGKKQQQSYLS
jgi:hypothetical protein